MNTVAIDIETTGLTATDQVTVVGLADDETYEIHYNSDGGRTQFDHDAFDWDSADREIDLYAWPNEERLLTRLSTAVNRFDLAHEGTILVGFNAEGFDFPVLRTRKLVHDVPWAFRGVNYLDIQGTFKYDWNTKGNEVTGFNKHPLIDFAAYLGLDVSHSMNKYEVEPMVAEAEFTPEDIAEFCDENGEDMPTKEWGSLVGIHTLYCELGIFEEHPYDPLDGDSSLCCQRWIEGDLAPVVEHNLSDLKMTLNLVELVPDYVHEGELRMTRL